MLPCTETTCSAVTYPISAINESVNSFRGAEVLVVEDEDPLRIAVVKMLRKKGLEVLEANGSAAIELLWANRDKVDRGERVTLATKAS